MPVILDWSKLIARVSLAGSVLVASACLPSRRPTVVPEPDELPRRVVLALDGLDYRDVQAARALGQFAAFRPPGRLISTFPSISDIAWHAIFGVQPPAGYQRVFYSTRHNAVLGDAFDAIRPIEYEERMDFAFDAKFHHLGAYLMSWSTARREIDTDVEAVLRTRGRRTVYIYNVGPDALQHTRGDVAQYLAYLDRALVGLQERYRERTGRALEIVVLSDHGHNRAAQASFLPVAESLREHGFRIARTLTSPSDVAFSVDGVTTGFGVFCHPDAEERVMAALVATAGVDIVTRRLPENRFLVQSGDATAEIEWRVEDGRNLYRYVPRTGDPLQLDTVMQRMHDTGTMRADRFADADAWVRATAASVYPAAVVRIVHGHREATRNPAPILVSLRDDYRVGLGMVSVANRMRPLGGTHGALSASNAVGVVMSTFQETPDDLAMTVRAQFGGFDDLREPVSRKPGFVIGTSAALRADRFARSRWDMHVLTMADTLPLALLTLTDRERQWSDDSMHARVEMRMQVWRRLGAGRRDLLVAEQSVPLGAWTRSMDGRTYALPADSLRLTRLEPGAPYVFRLWMDRFREQHGQWELDGTRDLLSLSLRAARDGVPWRY